MVRHIVMWQFKDCLTPSQKQEIAQAFKQDLECLVGQIDGLLSMEVVYDVMASSSDELLLDSSFENEVALDFYQEHPLHKAAALHVKDKMKIRSCIDYCK